MTFYLWEMMKIDLQKDISRKTSEARICGSRSRSVPKCHGSATLVVLLLEVWSYRAIIRAYLLCIQLLEMSCCADQGEVTHKGALCAKKHGAKIIAKCVFLTMYCTLYSGRERSEKIYVNQLQTSARYTFSVVGIAGIKPQPSSANAARMAISFFSLFVFLLAVQQLSTLCIFCLGRIVGEGWSQFLLILIKGVSIRAFFFSYSYPKM